MLHHRFLLYIAIFCIVLVLFHSSACYESSNFSRTFFGMCCDSVPTMLDERLPSLDSFLPFSSRDQTRASATWSGHPVSFVPRQFSVRFSAHSSY